MENKQRENNQENDSPIQINISISAENGKINGASEFADLLCSKRLHVKGYRIRFTQKRNDKKTVLVEANYRPIGTVDIMKGFVFVSSVDGSKTVMYGSPDREFQDNEQVLSVMFHDVFGINTEIARVENGMLNTSDIELAQRIVNFYSDFVERMIVPVYSNDPTIDKTARIIMALGNYGGRLDVGPEADLQICDGEDNDGNPEGEWHKVEAITINGVETDNCDFYGYHELTDTDFDTIIDYIEGDWNRKGLVEKIRTGIVRISSVDYLVESGFIKVSAGRLAINRGAKGSFVTAIWPYGVKMDNGDYIQYDEMDESDLSKIVAYIESDKFGAAFNCQRGSIDGSLTRCAIDYKPCKGFMCENFLKG